MGQVVVDEVNDEVRFEGVTITFPFSTSADGIVQQKVGTITITGAEGAANLLLGLSGASGPPSPPSAVNVEYIAYNATPAPASVTVLDPGGPGEPADWTLDIQIPQGIPGTPGDYEFLDAVDLYGVMTDGWTVTYVTDHEGTGEDGIVWTPIPKGDVLWPTTLSTTASSSTSPRLLGAVSASAGRFPYNWRPIVHGSCIVTGSADVRVDLIAYLGDPDAGGKIIARGDGIALGTAGVDRIPLRPNYPTTTAGNDGMVAAGEAASIFLRAVNVGNASSNWATVNTSTGFLVEVLPVP